MVAQERKSIISNVSPSIYTKSGADAELWLDAKREDDNVEDGLWRIGNTLYDLTDFIHKHPGGADWIEMTKGHDITEAFITHHLRPGMVEPYLKKYRVRETTRPRNVKLTFKEDGFYMTLRRRVIAKLPEIKKNTKIWTDLYVDGLFILTLITAICSQRYQSYLFAMACGLLYTWVGICGHNYLHLRDNYRMKYFNLLLMSYRDWRISHVLSHHMYPNSFLDCDILLMEPLFVWTPTVDSANTFQKYLSCAYAPILYCFVFPMEFVKKVILSIVRKNTMRLDDFIPFVFPVAMYLFGGNDSFLNAWKMFAAIILFGGFFYGIIGLNDGHHHPSSWHEGDAVRDDLDWGIYSLDTIMDREELRGNKLLALTNFGDHALHHMFPSLDHGILPELYNDFYKTLIEFEAECKLYPWFFETIKGQFQQLIRTEPEKLNSHEKYLLKHGMESLNINSISKDK